ncbi:MAG: tetratricopeptide repeat protein, partial [Deltaproteobacteria bacterium]|nr:tetratricopeptide repeat protein [Deltaproteobacteria bacterium]
LFLPVLVVLGTILVFYTSSRFRMPAVPFLAIGAGITCTALAAWVKQGRWGRGILVLALAGLLVLVSIACSEPRETGTEEFYLAKAYWGQGQLDRAQFAAEEAAEKFPGQARFQVLLGMIALSGDRPGDAVRHNLDAIALAPGNGDAYHNLGLAYLLLGRAEEAVVAVSKALSLVRNPRYLYTLARAYESSGDGKRAMEFYGAFLDESHPRDPYREQAGTRLRELQNP